MAEPGFVFGVAEGFEGAVDAARLSRDADLPSVINQLVRKLDPVVAGDDSDQFLLDGLRIMGLSEAEAIGEAQNVGIDDDALGETEGDSEDDVAGFAGDSGQGEKLGHVFGDLASESFDKLFGRAGDRLGLVVIKAGGANLRFQSGKGGSGHRFGRGEFSEKLGGYEIDANIRALRGEDGCDQQLPRVAVMERAFGVGIGGGQAAKQIGNARGREVAFADSGFFRRGFFRGWFFKGWSGGDLHAVILRLLWVCGLFRGRAFKFFKALGQGFERGAQRGDF